MNRIFRAWRVFNAPCREMARLASESLDRKPDRVEQMALRSHVIYCTACRRYTRQITFLHIAMEQLADRMEMAPPLPEEARAAIKQVLRDSPGSFS